MWSEACIEGLNVRAVDSWDTSQILKRLLDEARHHAERAQTNAELLKGLGTEPFDYQELNGEGVLTATGSTSLEPFGSVSSEHVLEFVCYTGGHGGFGPLALDGRVDVAVGWVANPAVEDYHLTISGEVRLGGGDALKSTTPADVSVEVIVVGQSEVVSGTIAGHDAGAL